MSEWKKNSISRESVDILRKKYKINPIAASIFLRRGITDGKDLLFYMENDMRFQHNPFLFANMEDAVDRILDAKEENEKVLIFGDRDVDGVTATTVLYDCLLSMGIDASFKVPQGDEAYGLTMDAVESFAKELGTLIITVDCGIANVQEIRRAQELGIDVIVADHHNPQESIPEGALILDAKLPDSGYPFEEISGCAVAYKLASALRFASTRWYKADIALLNARVENDLIVIECLKTRNLVPEGRLLETVAPGEKSIAGTKLPQYLQGQMIFTWNKKETEILLAQAFGKTCEFNMLDIKSQIESIYPSLKDKSLSELKNQSKLAKYGNHGPTELGGFYNIFVTYIQQSIKTECRNFQELEEKDLQLVSLAALADIMPMKNENRLFVRNGTESMNSGNVRAGLREIMSQLNLLGKRICSTDLSWTVVPNLNAAGRLGQADLVVKLFTSKDDMERESIAKKIIELNAERKNLTLQGAEYAREQAEKSIPEYNGKLCVVYDERINKGISGILAGKLVNAHNIPAMAMTKVNDVIIGSLRSCRGFDVTLMLEELKDFFVSHGGHNYAAGFSLEENKLDAFLKAVKDYTGKIVLQDKDEEIYVDAEIPPSYMTRELLDIVDMFEPYGEENQKLLFTSKNLPVVSGMMMGKTEKSHLKVTVDCGKTKWPCIMWNEGERLRRDFNVGDNVDILYNIERNTFNGMEMPQIMLRDIRKSQ